MGVWTGSALALRPPAPPSCPPSVRPVPERVSPRRRSVAAVAYGASVPRSTPDANASPTPAGPPPSVGGEERARARGARALAGDVAETPVVEVRRSARRRGPATP